MNSFHAHKLEIHTRYTKFFSRDTDSAAFCAMNDFQTPLSIYATQIINPFLSSRISTNHDYRVERLANREILIVLNVPLV